MSIGGREDEHHEGRVNERQRAPEAKRAGSLRGPGDLARADEH